MMAIGLLIGALISAKQHKELKLREARDPISAFMLGFIVINFGLMIGFCPIRATVLTAYGSIIGLIGIVFIAIGILFGSEYVKRWG